MSYHESMTDDVHPIGNVDPKSESQFSSVMSYHEGDESSKHASTDNTVEKGTPYSGIEDKSPGVSDSKFPTLVTDDKSDSTSDSEQVS